MNAKDVKKELESVILVLSEIFNPKQNEITDYVLPRIRDAIVLIDEQSAIIKKINDNKL